MLLFLPLAASNRRRLVKADHAVTEAVPPGAGVQPVSAPAMSTAGTRPRVVRRRRRRRWPTSVFMVAVIGCLSGCGCEVAVAS